MFDLSKLQQYADALGGIALEAASAFDPALVPTVRIAGKVLDAATNLAMGLNNTGLDQTALQAGLQALVDKVEAHAKATEASLGPDAPTG